MEEARIMITTLFDANVKGRKLRGDIVTAHDGAEGHTLERAFGIKANSSSSPDIGGYEMKKLSKVITFGDWGADDYAYSTPKSKSKRANIDRMNGWSSATAMTRSQFMQYFGSPNPKKGARNSWSGACFPKVGDEWNSCGQRMHVDNEGNISAQYSYADDTRATKDEFLPSFLRAPDKIITIAFWSCEKLKKLVNSKFNQNGYFICCKGADGVYTHIVFGPPFNFEYFIANVRNRKIYLDSGMNDGTTRPRAPWRASRNFWLDLANSAAATTVTAAESSD